MKIWLSSTVLYKYDVSFICCYRLNHYSVLIHGKYFRIESGGGIWNFWNDKGTFLMKSAKLEKKKHRTFDWCEIDIESRQRKPITSHRSIRRPNPYINLFQFHQFQSDHQMPCTRFNSNLLPIKMNTHSMMKI